MEVIIQSEHEKKNRIPSVVTDSLLLVFWFVITAGIRIWYFLFSGITIDNGYGYFEAAMIQKLQEQPVFPVHGGLLKIGVSHAYIENLSGLFRFTGNRMEAVAVWQAVMQVAALVLIVFAMRLMVGRAAAFVTGSLLSFLPCMITRIFCVMPETYFLFHWSVVLALLAWFYYKTRKEGWFRCNSGELYLMVTGFYLGIVCAWHFAGFLLLGFVFYLLLRNAPVVKERRRREQETEYERQLAAENGEEIPEEKYLTMSIASQSFILFFGMLSGMFCTFMKYSGVTGRSVWREFYRWAIGKWAMSGAWSPVQEVGMMQPVCLIMAVIAGILIQLIWGRAVKAQNRQIEEEINGEMTVKEKKLKEAVPEAAALEAEAVPEQQAQKQAERKIDFIENPLPLPKKHVARKMDFKISEAADDFDIDIKETDDFDIL